MTDQERRLKATRDFARRIVEAKEKQGAKDAKQWREKFEKDEKALGH